MHRSALDRGWAVAVAAILAASVTSTAAAGSAGGSTQRRAQLDGKTIPLRDVGLFQCHDLDFPVIRCFGSSAERDKDMTDVERSAELATVAAYVTWYADGNYGGSPSFTALWSEPDLTIYGWNDRISSFRTLNGGHPRVGGRWQWRHSLGLGNHVDPLRRRLGQRQVLERGAAVTRPLDDGSASGSAY